MTYYLHAKAHQDENGSFDKLSWKAQLNCICNHKANQRITADGIEGAVSSWMFPLKPIGLFVHGEKMTSETGELIQFRAHHQLARTFYHEQMILSYIQYNSVRWISVHNTLHDLPWLFQVWATKHILGIAGTIKFLAH
jgi:hypothetical protein